MARPDQPAPSTSSSLAPSARSTSGSICTATHWQPPWKDYEMLMQASSRRSLRHTGRMRRRR